MPTFPRAIPKAERVLQPRAERAITESQPKDPKFASKLPGDPLALRGIPAIGFGVTGAITGTTPESSIR